MKKYSEVKIEISIFENMDVIRTSGPDGDNNLPWVDLSF